jgi:hypothetical protein
LLRFWCSFSFCHLSQFLRISEACFHRRIGQVCYTLLFLVAFAFRRRTDKFRSQGRAWGRICFVLCSFGRTCFGRMNSSKVWSCRLIIFNVSVAATRCCSVCDWSWSVLHRRTETPHQQIYLCCREKFEWPGMQPRYLQE